MNKNPQQYEEEKIYDEDAVSITKSQEVLDRDQVQAQECLERLDRGPFPDAPESGE